MRGDIGDKKRVLITGGLGFLGSHLIEAILKNTNWDIVSLDRLDTSGNPNRIADMDVWEKEKHRVEILWWDLKSELNDAIKYDIGDFDYLLHVAAGSHVDRSIDRPMEFIMDNVVGTGNILNFYKDYCAGLNAGLPKFLYFSTDEVFGPAPSGVAYKEWDRFNAGNPYSATKAGAEALCDAYANTYKLPIIVTHCMNIFGERQHPEKFIPMTISKVLRGEKVIIHADKNKEKAGTRFYIHARNVADAVLYLLANGQVEDGSGRKGKYNIVGEREVDNLEMAKLIERYVHEWQNLPENQNKGLFYSEVKPMQYELVDFHSSRPGHDLRYALDGSLLDSTGFKFNMSFEESLKRTVWWSLNNHRWLML